MLNITIKPYFTSLIFQKIEVYICNTFDLAILDRMKRYMLAPHLTSAPRHQARGEAGQCRLCGHLYVFLLKCARTSSAGIQGKLDEGEGLHPLKGERKEEE